MIINFEYYKLNKIKRLLQVVTTNLDVTKKTKIDWPKWGEHDKEGHVVRERREERRMYVFNLIKRQTQISLLYIGKMDFCYNS